MAQMNRNANYLYSIDGNTVWERLRVVRGFIEDRKQALQLSELEYDKKQEELNGMSIDSYEYKKAVIFVPQSKKLIEECKNEITFLEELEHKLAIEAEKTRIEGKSDDEMYELNYFEELTQIQLLEVKAEMLALGHVSSETMKMLIKNPHTLERAVDLGLLSDNSVKALENMKTPILKIGGSYAKLVSNCK